MNPGKMLFTHREQNCPGISQMKQAFKTTLFVPPIKSSGAADLRADVATNSKYVNEETNKKEATSAIKVEVMKIMHLNIQGLAKKMPNIEIVLDNNDIDILCFFYAC